MKLNSLVLAIALALLVVIGSNGIAREPEAAAKLPADDVKLVAKAKENLKSLRRVGVSADGKMVYVNGYGILSLWNIETAEKTGEINLGFKTSVHAISPNLDRVWIAPADPLQVSFKAECWSVKPPKLRYVVEVDQSERNTQLGSVTVSPDGRFLAFDATDGRIHIVDAHSGKLLHSFKHQQSMIGMLFHPTAPLIRSTGIQVVTRFWDAQLGVRGLQFQSEETNSGGAMMVFAPDGASCLTRSNGAKFDQIIETASGRERCRLGYDKRFQGGFRFTADGLSLLAFDRDNGCIYRVDIGTGKLARFAETGKLGSFHSAESPDGQYLVLAPSNGLLSVWQWRSAPAQPVHFDGKRLGELWVDLAADDAAVAFRAIQALRSSPVLATALIVDRLNANETALVEIAKLLKQLNSDRFAEREDAVKALSKYGEPLRPLLWQVHARPDSTNQQELIVRVGALLSANKPSGALLRRLRAVEVLGGIASADARIALEKIAKNNLPDPAAEAAGRELRRLKSIPLDMKR